jgi:MYXO-CTERM domain-containing protein
MTSENVFVRPVNGEAIEGVLSHSSFNAVSFGAKAALDPNTTYEVVVVNGGLTDLAKNPIAEQSVLRFSTGDTIEQPMNPGGAGGMSQGGGGSGTSDGNGGGGGGGSGNVSGGAGMTSAAGSATSLGSGGQSDAPVARDPATATESGCGCSVPGRDTPARAAWLLVAGALLIRARRRAEARGQTP